MDENAMTPGMTPEATPETPDEEIAPEAEAGEKDEAGTVGTETM